MATKFRGEFTDILGCEWRIDIEDPAYSDAVILLDLTDSPLNIEYLSNSDYIEESVVNGSSVSFEAYSDTNFYFLSLIATSDLQFPVKIYYGASHTLYWKGYITANKYMEPYSAPPYPVTIFATDGLGCMKDIYYNITDPTETTGPEYYTGHSYESAILLNVLAKVGITSFTEFVNIYDANMASGTGDSPFDQVKIDNWLFKDKSCYEALLYILGKYHAKIRQVNGEIVIYRPVELKSSSIYGRNFTAVQTKTAVTLTPAQLFSRTTGVNDLRDVEGGTMIVQQQAKKVSIVQNYGNKESWIWNYELKKDTFNTGTNVFFGWTSYACTQSQMTDAHQEDGMLLKDKCSSPLSKYVYTEFGAEAVVSGNIMWFTWEALLYNYGTGTQSATIYFEIKDYYNNTYLVGAGSPDGLSTWSGSGHQIVWTPTNGAPVGTEGWQKLTMHAVGLPYAGPYRFTAYCLNSSITDTWLGIKNVKIYSSNDSVSTKVKKIDLSLFNPFTRMFRRLFSNKVIVGFKIPFIVDNPDATEHEYITYNSVPGKEIKIEDCLGDVTDSFVDNVYEQFAGSQTIIAKQSLSDAAAAFVTAHAADYTYPANPNKVILTRSSSTLIFSAQTAGQDFSGDTTITNLTGGLTGTPSTITPSLIGEVEIQRIEIIGTSGSVDITINAVTEGMEWQNPDVPATIHKFITDHSGSFGAFTLAHTSGGAGEEYLQVTENAPAGGFTLEGVNTAGDLIAGDPIVDQDGTASVSRVDHIVLSGSSGTANVLCNGITEEMIITESMVNSSLWSTRGGSEAIHIGDVKSKEIANQYSRMKFLISSLPIIEDNIISITPKINITGNFQDPLNKVSGNNRKFIFNRGTFDVRNRVWNMDLLELI